MFKKFIKFNILTVALFYFLFYNNVRAYEYIDSKNESQINDMIVEIFDAKEQYEDLAGDDIKSELAVVHEATSNSYWWPIGSEETIEVNGIIYAKGDPLVTGITSNFGYREDPFNRGKKLHSGIDISDANSSNNVNIIASKSGVVVYPTADVQNNCPSSSSLSNCGGGYGNYVVIQHSDGNYTLYGHMYEGSITVKAGDSVEQGQVIGKMGSSGNSTGNHLHFEVREGQNAYSATVDPLNYVSADTPRMIFSGSGKIYDFINSYEGNTGIVGDSYKIINIGDGMRSVGHGVTLENCWQYFQKYGYEVRNLSVGDTLPISIVDQVELDIIDYNRNYIENTISDNSIKLEIYQIDALISQMYNMGNISGFVNAYKKYGNTQEFFENWFFRGTSPGSGFEAGLSKRRKAEWTLFHTGEYVYAS